MTQLNAKDLVGEWNLHSFEQIESNQVLRSHPSSKGLLIYTTSGGMSVSMSRIPDTENLEIKEKFVRDLYYAGTFECKANMVLHHVEIALHDQHRNKTLPRRARLEQNGQRLILEALNSENTVIGTIIWQRRSSQKL